MAAEGLIQIAQPDQAELQHLADLLHLFHHRNKNQHRRSIWWRHFSVFRKRVRTLVDEYRQLSEVATTNLGRAKKKARDAQIVVTTAKRVTLWRDTMVTKWQHAFSQLVADGRFSVLGLVLLAALSQVCQIVGITADLEELGQAEVEKVLEEFGRETWGAEPKQDQHDVTEDLGEVIQRQEVPTEIEGDITMSQPPVERAENATPTGVKSTRKRTATANNKLSKKKRKKGNAIDDIFG